MNLAEQYFYVLSLIEGYKDQYEKLRQEGKDVCCIEARIKGLFDSANLAYGFLPGATKAAFASVHAYQKQFVDTASS